MSKKQRILLLLTEHIKRIHESILTLVMSYTEYEELIRIFLEYEIILQIKLNKTNNVFLFFG